MPTHPQKTAEQQANEIAHEWGWRNVETLQAYLEDGGTTDDWSNTSAAQTAHAIIEALLKRNP